MIRHGKCIVRRCLFGVHPDDREYVRRNLDYCILNGEERYGMQYRLRKGKQGYLWVKAMFSVIQSDGGDTRVYVHYHDITEERSRRSFVCNIRSRFFSII